MTEDNFLARWSRRKREADVAKSVSPETEAKAEPEVVIAPQGGQAMEAEFDPASLPPIESITGVSDITAFLRDGVPAELTRAALRRVWTADPAIRNFVGLAENAWDFTDPDAMPGFGPLESTDEVRRLIAQVVDQIGEMAKESSPEVDPVEISSLSDSKEIATGDAETEDHREPEIAPSKAAEILGTQVLPRRNIEDAAAQDGGAEATERPKQLARRSHGGALPE